MANPGIAGSYCCCLVSYCCCLASHCGSLAIGRCLASYRLLPSYRLVPVAIEGTIYTAYTAPSSSQSNIDLQLQRSGYPMPNQVTLYYTPTRTQNQCICICGQSTSLTMASFASGHNLLISKIRGSRPGKPHPYLGRSLSRI